MAEQTETIVTKFVGDLSELDATVAGYDKTLNSASAATDKLDQKTTDLGASVGKLGDKYEIVKQSAARTNKEVDLTGRSINDLKARLDALTKNRNALIDPKAIARTNNDIAATRKQINTLEGSLLKTRKGAGGLFTEITQGASQAAPGLSNVTSLFGGMGGPIGIAGAAVAGFIANFSRLDSVQVFFDAVKIGFDQVGDRLANLDFSSFFDPKTAATDAANAAQIAQALDGIQDAQLGINKANADAERQIAGLNQQLRDRTKTDEERLAIADQITKIENTRAADEAASIKARIAIQQRTNKTQLEGLGEVSDANKAALNELEVQLINSDARRIQLTESTERRRNSILEQGSAEAASIAAKGAAAQAKADAERAKNAEARAAATAKLDQTVAELAEQQRLRGLTDAEKEVEIVKKKYADLEAVTLEGIAKLRAVSPPNAQSEITKREADAVIAIETAKNAELAAIEQKRAADTAKAREEALETLRQSLLTETETQREAVLTRLDEDLALAEQNIADKDELLLFRNERVKSAEEELSKILSDEDQKRLEAEKAALEERTAIQEEQSLMIRTAAADALALVVEAAASGEDAQEQAAKAIIGIFLDTLEKIIQGQIVAITAGSAAQGAATGGAPGAAVGIAAGIALGAIIKGLFAVVKAQIQGNYEGDPYVSGTPMWSGRDGHLRRLDEGERVVTKRDNLAHWDELEAMRNGTYDDLIYSKHIRPAIEAMGFGDQGKVNAFTASDTGQRIAQSVMLAKFYDANIVGELKAGRKQDRASLELLAQIAKNGRRNASRW